MKYGQFFVFFAGIGFLMAREISRNIVEHRRLDDNSVNKDSLENRKHKPHHDLFLFMGGLQGLVTFIMIKIKIVLVAMTIIGFIALALKLFGLLKYTGYLNKNVYPPLSPLSHEYSSYPGGPPLSSYSSSNHHDNEIYSNDWPSYSEHYARSSSKFSNQSVNMTEMVYSLMNIDKKDCQSRLICELRIILSRSPFYHYSTRYDITREESSVSRNNVEDCKEYYTKCLGTTTRVTIGRRRKRRARTGQYSTDYSQIV